MPTLLPFGSIGGGGRWEDGTAGFLKPDTNGDGIELFDSTGAESATIFRDLTNLEITSGVGGNLRLTPTGGLIFITGTLDCRGIRPAIDSSYGLGLSNRRYTETWTQGLNVGARTVAASVSTTNEDYYIFVNSTAAYTITLDTDETIAGRRIVIVDVNDASTNNITIATEGAETIDGAATATINTQYGSIGLICDGTNWFSA